MYTQHEAKIDWLTFVLRVPPHDDMYTPTSPPPAAHKAIRAEFGSVVDEMLFQTVSPMKHGRAPYRWGWRDEISRAVLWYGGAADHMTIEFSGQACEALRRCGILNDMLQRGSSLLTRVDVAIDMVSELTPIELVAMREKGRTKTSSTMESSTGVTCYVGSMNSEHYARVYRYKEPHPRSHLLRAEFVSRRARAKNLGAHIAEHGLDSVLSTLWSDAGMPGILDFNNEDMKITLNEARPEREGKNTVAWLIKQAAPAFQRMLREGYIENGEQFLRKVFLGEEFAE